jgi:hypothetical protein
VGAVKKKLDDPVILVYERWDREVGWTTHERCCSRILAETRLKNSTMTRHYLEIREMD